MSVSGVTPGGFGRPFERAMSEMVQAATAADAGRLLSHMLDGSAERALVLLDRGRRIVAWSDGAHELYGHGIGEVLGRSAEFLFDGDGDVLTELIAAAGRHDRSVRDCRQHHRAGHSFAAHLELTVRRDPHDRTPLGFLLEATPVPAAADEDRTGSSWLRQSPELDAIGRVARRVVDRLARGDKPDYGVLADRGVVMLKRGLQAFLGDAPAAAGPCDVGQLLASGEKGFLSAAAGDQTELIIAVTGVLPRLAMPPDRLRDVLTRLADNARLAMPDGGPLRIAARTHLADASHPALAPGRYVVLSVRDAGCGMDTTIRARAFEPLFTTRPGADGLGLAYVFGAVRADGGDILMQSEPGVGTTVELYLKPAAPASAPDANACPTILLVEDDDGVRSLVSQYLTRIGYRVAALSDGERARETAAELGDGLKLLMTDMLLPSLSGPEVAAAVRAQHPGLRVLFLSGFAADSFADEQLPSDASFLQKPFTLRALSEKVAELLPEGRPAQR